MYARYFGILSLCLAALWLGGCDSNPYYTTIGLCNIVADPGRYDKKDIELRVIVNIWPRDGSTLSDKRCLNHIHLSADPERLTGEGADEFIQALDEYHEKFDYFNFQSGEGTTNRLEVVIRGTYHRDENRVTTGEFHIHEVLSVTRLKDWDPTRTEVKTP